MHMFRIEYVTNHANGIVESGKVIVMCDSHEQAIDIICLQLNLPPSRTRVLQSNKIKPPCYPVESRQSHPSAKVSMRSQRDVPPPEHQNFSVTITASNVRGGGERQVLRKIGDELQSRAAMLPSRHNLELSIECATRNGRDRAPTGLARLEMLRPGAHRVQGGPMRSK